MSIQIKESHYGNLSPEFAVLGLLYSEPMHGYDLHKKLVLELGQVWHLSQSQAYAILKRLENHGYISGESVPQEKLPPRQLLHITPAGREHFMEWFQTPSGGSIRSIRMEFLTRLYFARHHQPEMIDQIFKEQTTETEKNIERLATTLQGLPVEQFFNRMSLEMRIRQLHLALNWLEDCKKSFSGEYSTPPSIKGDLK